MEKNITSANSTAILAIEELFPNGVTLEQYATDQAITQAEETIAETRMGIDGQMVAGFTPSIKSVTITLEPSSPSLSAMDTIYESSQEKKTIYRATLTISLPSIGKTLTYSGGVMKTAKPLPDLKKVLEPVSYGFDFEKLSKTSN